MNVGVVARLSSSDDCGLGLSLGDALAGFLLLEG